MQTDVGIWFRVSSGGQDEQNQVPDLERYCGDHDYNIRKRYEVHAKSAFHGKQQDALDEALADMANGTIKVLVIWHSDRIERREGKALLDVLASFAAAGGRVESVQEPTLGQLDFGGQVLTFISGLVNHEKSKHLSDQVTAAHKKIREAGYLTGKPPWGYVSRGRKYQRTMVPTDLAREYVPQIFERITAGSSLREVAAWLDSEGVASGAARWWPETVRVLVLNPAYVGRRVDADGRVILRCEALVDADTFTRAGKALRDSNTRPVRGPADPAGRAMLAGAVQCPRCEGSPMYRVYGGRKPYRATYYRCTGRGPQRKGCGNVVRTDTADAAVNELLATALDLPVRVEKISRGTDYAAELAEVKLDMRELAALDLPDAEYDARLAELRELRDDLASRETVPDRVEWVETGETYALVWEDTPTAERGAWLRDHGFTVLAEKDRVVVRSTDPNCPDAVWEPGQTIIDPVEIWQAG